MSDTLLQLLRCPMDPKRESTLERQEQSLVCRCGVKFPVRNGLPILIADQAELPDDCKPSSLPCRKRDS
jgi:hypothetical protein